MYAVISTGGKQYKVAKGDIINVELCSSEDGAEIEFSEILFLNNGKESKVGKDIGNKSKVVGKVLGTVAGPKITSVKKKIRQSRQRKFGHRQKYTQVEITAIK